MSRSNFALKSFVTVNPRGNLNFSLSLPLVAILEGWPPRIIFLTSFMVFLRDFYSPSKIFYFVVVTSYDGHPCNVLYKVKFIDHVRTS